MGQDATTRYSGSSERSVDAKKRVAVPAGWLSQSEGEAFFVSPHPVEGYLMVMPPAEFDRWEQQFKDSSLSAAEKRMAIRKFYSEAHAVSTDKQGRTLLREKHCGGAGLTSEIVFIGSGSRFEIWSRDRFA